MADIKGISGMSPGQIAFELNQGAKLVVYQSCVSALVLTIMESTDVYLIPAGQSRVIKGLPWSLLTLVAAWWGIP